MKFNSTRSPNYVSSVLLHSSRRPTWDWQLWQGWLATADGSCCWNGVELWTVSGPVARDVVQRPQLQPPVFVTAALKRTKQNLLSPGHVAARRSNRYKTLRNTKIVLH